MEEFLLRLHRLVQRSGVAAMDTAKLVVGDLVLNVDTREVSRAGEQLQLTATQFELLRYLMENPKRVTSKAQILDRVWNYEFGSQTIIVELYISYLRKKVDAVHPPMIHTVRGAGYAICGAVGVASYASMDSFLIRQVDAQLSQAAKRSTDPGRPSLGGFNGRPDPLYAKGQSVGTLNPRILSGQINSGGFLNSDTTRSALSPEDKQTLLALPQDGNPVNRSLSNGDYRVVALGTGFGDVLVTGLPLTVKESTLAALVWTFVFVSLGGLLLVGLAGTMLIRRTMKPLEQLSEVATRVAQLPLDAGEVALAVRVPPSNVNPGTEVGAAGNALNLMLENVASALEAPQRSEAKVRQLIADASHELRTPLTAIRGYTELMRMTETSCQTAGSRSRGCKASPNA